MHKMAPDPGEMAITQAARKNASQTCNVMMVPRDLVSCVAVKQKATIVHRLRPVRLRPLWAVEA
ncbi:hypothetical protein PSUB009319_37730 [Ralstonia sp. SET104]|nr:hypothetical protein PSUB009319_37730 [Ralstonia sp. SET104]